MKKVLIVCPSYPPEGGGGTTRFLKFSKYLVDYGWQSVIVTMQTNASGVYAPYLLKEVPEIIEVHHIIQVNKAGYLYSNVQVYWKQFSAAVFRRFVLPFLVPDQYILRLPKTVVRSVKLIRRKKMQVLISSSPCHSIQLAGYLIKKITKKPWVLDFRDGWIENVFVRPKNKIKYRIEYMLEAVCLRNCDKIIVTTKEHKEKLLLFFGDILRHKIVVITNGYDTEDFENTFEEQRNKLVMSYTGSLGYNRMPTFFLESLKAATLKKLGLKKDLIVNFYGASSHRARDEVVRLGLEGLVNLKDQIKRNQCINVMVNSDILLDFLSAERGSDHTISGKLFEYLRAGKLILAFCDEGPEATLIRNTKSGVVVGTKDVDEATEIILDLYDKWRNGGLEAGSNESTVQQFDRKELTKKLASLLDTLLDNQENHV